MLLFAAALIAADPAPAVVLPHKPRPLASSPNCPRTTSYYAWRRDKPVKPQKLTELPPANAYAAVLRHNGRCEDPVVIRYNLGGR